MTRDELKHYRTELQTLSGTLNEELAHDTRELRRDEEPDLPGGPMASTEERTDAGAQEVEVGLINNQQHLLAEVIAALDRIDCGDFGVCEACGRKIPKARLDALPYARTCIRCARVAKPVAG
jgi:DnaK suppressor protein